MDDKILFKDECYAIQGAVFEVYRAMGPGFLEPVYQKCLEKELHRSGVPFVSQPELQLYYKGDLLHHTYKPDLICFDKIILELNAVKALLPEHEAQILNYLNATGMKLGLLINFGSYPKATVQRFIL